MSVNEFVPNQQSAIIMSQEAAEQVKAFLAEEEDNGEGLYLRVFVQGGGCSGFQYGFSFDEVASDDDLVVEIYGLKVLIDPISLPYLEGAEITYESSLAGSRFSINNPNAQTTCGCGSSFTV